ncbi:TonB-dependent receptor [Polymorphobacter sp. PAMC 29334]|uniref:TonB-dependent receptor n=1 Tax=Polymorphobacter sp. PAMC 29334 TaxID=2862331 RepID=UPI001C76A7F7|nr:TonB-dependent receptor [Polymorphobacter sp. PAMC 29334]QYE36004.1 TonB-dependent receptor [Polymorphobacter sp. PAMC 29334]
MKNIWLASCALIAASGGGGAAVGQTAPPVAPATAAATAFDANDIIITATRRSQVLSDVPIAVSAVSAEQLQNSGGSDIRQLNQLAPSLLVSSATNEASGVARIRGIGTVGENPGLESSVAVFIDGVYRSRTGVGLTELGEVDRIEVLRGPQGTLFGRNASAGLINIITKGPSFDLGGNAEASYGNFNYYRLAGSVTGPVVGDKIAARIDGVYVKRDGLLLTDSISGRKTGDRDRYLIRGQLLIKPTDDLSIRLIGDYSHKAEECCAAAFLSPARNLSRDAQGNVVASPNSLIPIINALGGVINQSTGSTPFSRFDSITPGVNYHQRSKDYGLSGEVNWDLGAVKLTSISAYRVYEANNGSDADFENLDILRRNDLDRKFKTFTQELRLQGTAFANHLDFLVGAYYAHENLTVRDDLKFGADAERYSNCVLADNFARALGVGAALVNVADSSCFNRTTAAALLGSAAVPASVKGQIALLSGLSSPANSIGGFRSVANAIGFPTASPLFGGTGVVRDVFDQTSRNYAFFTHNVISIVPDKLLLTIGARYTNEQKTLDTSFNHNNTFCAALRASPLAALGGLPCAINGTSGTGFTTATDPGATKNEDRVTGAAILSYKPSKAVLTYASYSRGYKAGGFNLDTSALNAAKPQASNLRFEPELVTNYELGAKLDLRQFKLNGALFYEEFDQFQLNTFNGVNFEVTNIQGCADSVAGGTNTVATTVTCASNRARPGVVSKGAELEAFIYPAKDVTFTAGFTYQDTKYAKNLTGLGGIPLAPTLFQLPGSQLSNASVYTTTGSVAWTPAIDENFSALAYLDFRYQSDLNTGSDLDAEKMQNGFILVNARIGLYGKGHRYGIELWSQNLLNQQYQQVAADAPLQGGGTINATAKYGTSTNQLYIVFPAEPRTFGVTVRAKF